MQKITTPKEGPALTARRPASFGGKPLRAVLFDVDGTLYRQGPLRLRMAAELALLPVKHGLTEAITTWRALRAFRSMREELRRTPRNGESLGNLQFANASAAAGVDRARLEAIVSQWIFERPLRHLRACRRAGVEDLLRLLAERGLAVGAFSDYPVEEKLAALGIADSFSVKLCATEPGVGEFKPSPRGFLRACELWGLRPSEVLYVGDRPEVDAAGAAACGMPCAIVGRTRRRSNGKTVAECYTTFSSFRELQDALLT